MIFPGGGGLASRVWASIRVKIHSAQKWLTRKATNTAAFKHAMEQLEQFAFEENDAYIHAFKIATSDGALQCKCEIFFFIEAIRKGNADC